jgi:Zn-dependent oligopeptidase
LEETYKDFVRGGANLDAVEKQQQLVERLKSIREELKGIANALS